MADMSIHLSQAVMHQLNSLPREEYSSVAATIGKLKLLSDPFAHVHVNRLKVDDGPDRVQVARAGDYRIIFEVDQDNQTVNVLTIMRKSLLDNLFGRMPEAARRP